MAYRLPAYLHLHFLTRARRRHAKRKRSRKTGSLRRLAFHGVHGRKLVGYLLDQFSEIPLLVVSMGPSTARIGYCQLSILGNELVIRDVRVWRSIVR
jgi:hypothetical protein